MLDLDPVKICLQKLSEKINADIGVFNAEVNSRTADFFIKNLRNKENKKENFALILTTLGGDPDAGYRIVKSIKRHYKKFILYVFGSCKSTGTLMALGADEIVMTEFGEFGPLDIQLTKDDELINTSGLSYLQSLYSLNENLLGFFEAHFFQLKRNSGNTITTKTAAHIACELSAGLITPISGQIDPIKLGEVQRAIKIAEAYGERLAPDNRRQRQLIQKLISEYPSHSFVIDIEEAKEIFGNLRDVNDEEVELEHLLFTHVRSEALGSSFIQIFDIITEDQEDVQENIN
ncbi:Clp protease/crotonase-like domain-containing protein [Niabella aquatica]